jgi:hypothetical protein
MNFDRKEDDKEIGCLVRTAAIGVSVLGGCTIWAVGYDAGFQRGLKQQPSVVHGNQTINNTTNFFSRDAETFNEPRP